jgi:hypothetical protein
LRPFVSAYPAFCKGLDFAVLLSKFIQMFHSLVTVVYLNPTAIGQQRCALMQFFVNDFGVRLRFLPAEHVFWIHAAFTLYASNRIDGWMAGCCVAIVTGHARISRAKPIRLQPRYTEMTGSESIARPGHHFRSVFIGDDCNVCTPPLTLLTEEEHTASNFLRSFYSLLLADRICMVTSRPKAVGITLSLVWTIIAVHDSEASSSRFKCRHGQTCPEWDYQKNMATNVTTKTRHAVIGPSIWLHRIVTSC